MKKQQEDIFKRITTPRGFTWFNFKDSYDNKCSLSESSNAETDCVWLGITKPGIIIQYKDAQAAGLNLKKKYPETNECGWCDLPLPKGAMVESRMHLTREQAKALARELNFFAKHGYLDSKEDGDAER
jgi:hypothetical protein